MASDDEVGVAMEDDEMNTRRQVVMPSEIIDAIIKLVCTRQGRIESRDDVLTALRLRLVSKAFEPSATELTFRMIVCYVHDDWPTPQLGVPWGSKAHILAEGHRRLNRSITDVPTGPYRVGAPPGITNLLASSMRVRTALRHFKIYGQNATDSMDDVDLWSILSICQNLKFVTWANISHYLRPSGRALLPQVRATTWVGRGGLRVAEFLSSWAPNALVLRIIDQDDFYQSEDAGVTGRLVVKGVVIDNGTQSVTMKAFPDGHDWDSVYEVELVRLHATGLQVHCHPRPLPDFEYVDEFLAYIVGLEHLKLDVSWLMTFDEDSVIELGFHERLLQKCTECVTLKTVYLRFCFQAMGAALGSALLDFPQVEVVYADIFWFGEDSPFGREAGPCLDRVAEWHIRKGFQAVLERGGYVYVRWTWMRATTFGGQPLEDVSWETTAHLVTEELRRKLERIGRNRFYWEFGDEYRDEEDDGQWWDGPSQPVQ